MHLFKGIAIYLAIAGLIMAGYIMNQIMTPDPIPVSIADPAENPYTNTVAASGIVESVDKNINIGVPQGGLVQRLYVNVADPVRENDPLFQIDSRELIALLVVQKANLEVAKESMQRLRDQLKRLESVSDKRAISQEEVTTRRHDVQIAEAQVLASEALMKQTELLIDRLTVRAPKDGVILQSNIRVGEYVATGSSAMILGDLRSLQVRADIDEQNASKVLPTARATAFPKNNTTLAIPLVFSRIEPYVIPKRSLTGSSEERVDTRVLQVLYRFDAPSFPLYVGQQVDVFIELPPPPSQTTTHEQP